MQPELSRVIEQVSKEKGIDRAIVVQAVENAMLSAAKKVIGGDMRIEAQYNPEIGEVELFKILTVVEQVTNPETEISLQRMRAELSTRTRRSATSCWRSSTELRPDRRSGCQAEPDSAASRRRARHHLQRVQGSKGRAHPFRDRAAFREEEHHRQSRPDRRDLAGEGADSARALSAGGSHSRLHSRRRDGGQGAADRLVAHPSGLPDQAVRAGGAGDLRGHRRGEGSRARAGRPRQDRRRLARLGRRSGRRLRRA